MNTLNNRHQSFWAITLVAASILLVVDGARRSMGLFVSPLNTTTGLGIASISFAMAVGQFIWGAAQPVAGAIADRYGPGRVLAAGFIALALGSAITPYMSTSAGLIFSIGILSAAGGGACSLRMSETISCRMHGFVYAPLRQEILDPSLIPATFPYLYEPDAGTFLQLQWPLYVRRSSRCSLVRGHQFEDQQ